MQHEKKKLSDFDVVIAEKMLALLLALHLTSQFRI